MSALEVLQLQCLEGIETFFEENNNKKSDTVVGVELFREPSSQVLQMPRKLASIGAIFLMKGSCFLPSVCLGSKIRQKLLPCTSESGQGITRGSCTCSLACVVPSRYCTSATSLANASSSVKHKFVVSGNSHSLIISSKNHADE
jgi:hypothetical protein